MAITNSTTRRFQNTLGTSFKFWQVTREGRRLHFQWGRIGTEGQPLMKEFSSEWRAERELGMLVNQKLAKGYVETTLAGVPFMSAKSTQVAGHAHQWHRTGNADIKLCLLCDAEWPAEQNCTHPETWLRIADNIYRCKTCGSVNAPPAGGDGTFSMLTAVDLSAFLASINAEEGKPVAPPRPAKAAPVPVMDLKPRRKITLVEE